MMKKLYKKYPSLEQDYQNFLQSLKDNPECGVDLGGGIHKVRMFIASKGKGKSGGAKIITLTILLAEDSTEIGLHYIYDKSNCETLTDKEIKEILKSNGL